uniref:Uncharacterized protein n=1 Tax=Mantoniella tinhauana virus 1 TaxID=3111543 RepID=A0AB38ZMK7_9VIRU
MEEFKDKCQELEVQCDEITADIRAINMDYRLAERYTNIDQEIYEMMEWYENVKNEKQEMMKRLERVSANVKKLNNDVQSVKLREFSRDRHGGLCLS